jgi:hypothetical protein
MRTRDRGRRWHLPIARLVMVDQSTDTKKDYSPDDNLQKPPVLGITIALLMSLDLDFPASQTLETLRF